MATQFGPYDSYIAAQRRALLLPPVQETVNAGTTVPGGMRAVPPAQAAKLFPGTTFSPVATPANTAAPAAPPATTVAPPAYPGYLTPAQQLAQAQAYVNAQLLPYQQELARQQAAAAQQNISRGLAIQQSYQALADYLKGVGPTVQAGYQSAANADASYAKGYSDTMRVLEAQNAAKTNQFLAEQGSPQTVTPTGAGSDVLYGLNGVGPAEQLQAAGAAFGAAAANLPATTALRGTQDFVANQFAGADQQAQFNQQLADVAARAPGLLQQALSGIQSDQAQLQSDALTRAQQQASFMASQTGNQYQVVNGQAVPVLDKSGKPVPTAPVAAAQASSVRAQQQAAATAISRAGYAYRIGKDGWPVILKDAQGNPMLNSSARGQQVLAQQRQAQIDATNTALGLKAQDQSFQQAATKTKLNQSQQRIALEQKRAAAQLAQSQQRIDLQLQGLGIRQKELALKAAQAQWKMTHPASKGGFTAAQKQKNASLAADSARVAYQGEPNNIVKVVENGQVVVKNQPIAPKGYQEVLRDLLIHGIPLETAQQALNRYYKRGERGRPILAIQERQLLERGGTRAVQFLRQMFGASGAEARKALAAWKQTGVPGDFNPAEFFKRWRAPVTGG